MRNCYDSLLSAAAATANSAYGIHYSLIYTFVYCSRCNFVDKVLGVWTK